MISQELEISLKHTASSSIARFVSYKFWEGKEKDVKPKRALAGEVLQMARNTCSLGIS